MATRRSAKGPKLEDLAGQPDAKAPLDWQQFLGGAQPVLKKLQDDLRTRAKASASIAAALQARHAAEKDQKRTGDSFVEWQDHFIEQVAASWLLSCVFVRTLEDRGLLGHNRLAGPGATDSFRLFLELAPSLNERDYLLTIFREFTRFPATKELFDSRHNPLWLLTPSAEGAKALVQLFQQPRVDVPAFRFGQSDTGFLGWLYQDLDAGVRERFALLQTPRFIESFILDRTLEPAIAKFGLDDTTLIDPTCGSGHFLLGAFERLFDHRLRNEPGLSKREAARRALDAVFGADLNPYAVAIARFRLTLAVLDKAGFTNLSGAPELPLHVVVADSLLHNPHGKQAEFGDLLGKETALWKGQEFALEDDVGAREVLHRQFSAVVGNPPYIVPSDAARNAIYRTVYKTAHKQYQLSCPFTERFFQLARPSAFVGTIISNGFMKREFGKPMVEEFLPSVNLTLIVNTSGAFIPGHGTPTVMLFGTAEPAQGSHVHSVLAKRGEPSTPGEPEHGLVWSSIRNHWQERVHDDEFITVADVDRPWLERHPWILAGGGAIELIKLIEARASGRLSQGISAIGRTTVAGEDDVWIAPKGSWSRRGLGANAVPLVIGEVVRDWAFLEAPEILYPYSEIGGDAVPQEHPLLRALWPWRRLLENRTVFGKRMKTSGRPWWEHLEHYSEKLLTPKAIAFAFVATHNHFVFSSGGELFNRTAPVIKLPATATETDHLALLAYLNSSIACFWMKQVFFPKGGSGIGRGIQDEEWESRFEFDGTKLATAPLPRATQMHVDLARALHRNAVERAQLSPMQLLSRWLADPNRTDPLLATSRAERDALLARGVALQERLDWQVYADLGVLTADEASSLESSAVAACIEPGSRAFERLLSNTEPTTAWFVRNNYARPDAEQVSPLTTLQMAVAQQNKNVRLLERPEHKRRWGVPDHSVEERAAARTLLLQNSEQDFGPNTSRPREIDAKLRGWFGPKFEVLLELAHATLIDVLSDAAVPFLAAERFTDGGLDRLAEWERTWDLQRREDAGEKLDSIPIPPKYGQGDFRSTTCWQLRGPLDVPKERFISYPGCESDEDGEPVYGWAGWDHEKRARALATLYVNRRDQESWSKDRLTPMLAGLLELSPWLKQWHAAASDEYAGVSPAAYYEGFLDEECRKHGLTREELRAWRPPEKKRASAKVAAPSVENGAWRLPETLSRDTAAYFALASAALIRPAFTWRTLAAAQLALSGKTALTFLRGADAKAWKRNLGDDHKIEVDGNALVVAHRRALDELKQKGIVVERADGVLAATGALALDAVRPSVLVDRVRFVLDHVMPKIESEAQVVPLFTAQPTKAKNAKRKAV